MEGLLLTLAVLACPVGMGLMMWFMGKGMRRNRNKPVDDLDALRTEHRQLGEEIDRLEGSRVANVDLESTRR